MSGEDDRRGGPHGSPPPEQAPPQDGRHTRRSLLRKLAYSTPAIVALSVGARQAEGQPPAPPGFKPPPSPFNPLNGSSA